MTHQVSFGVREIEVADNDAVAAIIREVMTEYGACGEGFAIHDSEVTQMAETYKSPRSKYLVVTSSDRVVGGAGIAPLAGEGEQVCELRKMYFLPEARGYGMGKKLLESCLLWAAKFEYRSCYLETLKSMTAAQSMYVKSGFRRIEKPMGLTGHFGCDAWYLRAL